MAKRKEYITFHQNFIDQEEKVMLRIILVIIGVVFIVGLTAFGLWFSNSDVDGTNEHGDDMINKSTEK